MATLDTNRFHGRCKALYLGSKPVTLQELHPLLLRHFPLCSAEQLHSSATAHEISTALQSSAAKLCVIDVENGADTAAQLIPELVRREPKLGIVTVLPSESPHLILPFLRLGATDFLTRPFQPDAVAAAAQKLIKLFPVADDESQPAKIYCVMPAKGACGATTIACNLAFHCGRLAGKRILLADLDPITGTIGFLLKIKSAFSFADVLGRAADIDSDLWKAMVTDYQGLDILLSPESPIEGASELQDAGTIFDYARYNYPIVIADSGSAFGDWSLSQAHLSDEVLLISTNELSSLHSAQRVVQHLENNGIGRWKIKLILNRYDPNLGMSRELIANALGVEIFHVLPTDDVSVQRSLMEGKPIAAVSTLGKCLATLAERLAGREKPTRKHSSFAGLLSLFSRTSS